MVTHRVMAGLVATAIAFGAIAANAAEKAEDYPSNTIRIVDPACALGRKRAG